MSDKCGKFYIERLGCAKNQVDAEVLANRLENLGYTMTDDASEADLVLVNTCGFIESAREESVNAFFDLRNTCPKAKIILSGCLAQRYADQLEAELPEADAIFGNRDLRLIDDVVRQLQSKTSNETIRVTPEYPDPDDDDDARNKLFNFPGSAFVKISEGCNHRCGFCAIPLIRGALRSRPEKAILAEITRLVKRGIREINLVAQDLAAYGWDWDNKSHFEDLLTKIDNLEGDFVVRLLYIHPDWMTDSIIETVSRCKKVLHYFDIPFQHASAKLLRPMRRTGDSQSYIALIERIRKAIPDAAIRTTIMLGFPGDTEEDFNEVLHFIEACRFTWMGSFIYSLEEDTPAFELTSEKEHKALAKEAAKWQKKLQAVQEKITAEQLKKFVGRTLPVLIEEVMEDADLAIGRIYAQAPEVDGLTVVNGTDMKAGNIYTCKTVRVNGIDLEAVKIDD